MTFTPTATPTATQTPSATPTFTPLEQAEADLKAENSVTVRVKNDGAVLIREEPFRNADVILSLLNGTRLTVRGESVKNDDQNWLPIRTAGGVNGWVPESAVIPSSALQRVKGVDMLFIQAGKFLSGTDSTTDMYADPGRDAPLSEAYLDSYWIGRTEVTNAQYRSCVEEGVCDAEPLRELKGNRDNYPVTNITREQAQTFCEWLGGRLPSDDEWEKAARGVDARIYPWGDAWPSVYNDLSNLPLYLDAAGNGRDLFPAGNFPLGQSPYGVMEMSGNAWEWVQSGNIRGGSCDPAESYDYRILMRSAHRGQTAKEKSYYIGFRCVIK